MQIPWDLHRYPLYSVSECSSLTLQDKTSSSLSPNPGSPIPLQCWFSVHVAAFIWSALQIPSLVHLVLVSRTWEYFCPCGSGLRLTPSVQWLLPWGPLGQVLFQAHAGLAVPHEAAPSSPQRGVGQVNTCPQLYPGPGLSLEKEAIASQSLLSHLRCPHMVPHIVGNILPSC